MKRLFLLFFVSLFVGFSAYATMNEGQVYSSSVCNYSYDCPPPQADIYCYKVDDYWIEVPNDGLLTISGNLTRTNHPTCGGGSNLGSVSLTLYNKFGGYLTSRTSSGSFSIDVNCVALGDSFYVLITGSSALYSIEFNMMETLYAYDAEPNDQFSEANALPSATFTQGHIGYGHYDRDIYDKYLVVLDDDGTLQATIESDANMYLELFNRTGGYMTGRTVGAGGGLDTILLGCLAAGDTFYLQVNDFECGGYKIRWDMINIPSYTYDLEPNDEFVEAPILNSGVITEGHIGYGLYDRDNYDKYIIVIDDDGTLQATIESDANMYLELFNRTGGYMTGRTVGPGGGLDTILWSCLALGDTFYLQVNDNTCGGYKIRWDMIDFPSYDYDTEPNNDFFEAPVLSSGIFTEGHIGYGPYNRDNYDKYLIIIDDDGTLQATIESDASMYLELFNRTGGYMTGRTIGAGGGLDTILGSCLGVGDTFYLQVNDNACGGYKIRWDMIDMPNFDYDTEPNNDFIEAPVLSSGVFTEGHIGYGIYNRDNYDKYLIVIDDDGTLQATIESDANIYLELFNRTGGYMTGRTVGPGGGHDTILWGCLAAGDTFYLEVDDNECSGYKIRWDMIDMPGYDYDTEPNNNFVEATIIAENIHYEGHIGYGYYTNDNADYYRTNMNGIGSIVVSGSTSNNTYLSFYKSTGLLGSQILNGNFEVLRSCLNASDDIYLKFDDYSNNCNGYGFTYELFYDGNNSGESADTLNLIHDTWYRDNIGYDYGNPNGRDNVDILKIVPLKGDIAVFNAKSWSNISMALYNDEGTLLHDSGTTNDTTSFSYFLNVLETYYLKINYSGGCTPYKVKYEIPAICPSEIYLTGDLTQSLYKAGQKIVSDGIIPAGSHVLFQAQEFDLLENFEVEHTAVFNTQTGGCQ